MERIKSKEEEEEEEEEEEADTILDSIRPPEDPGLEDCALPPESIMEAFSRAAASLAVSFDGEGGGSVQDNLLAAGEILPPVWPSCGVGGEGRGLDGDLDEGLKD